jgi:hypothetical protein
LDKNSFISLLQRFTASSPSEADVILSLREEYPYSQLLQTLSARFGKDHTLPSAQQFLTTAAIYAADRSVLKEVMTTVEPAQTIVAQQAGKEDAVIKAEPEIATVQNIPSEVKAEVRIRSIESDLDVADEVMRDLNLLITSKHNFEMLFVEYAEIEAKPVSHTVKPEDSEVSSPESIPDENDTPKEKGKSRKARIIELARAMGATDKPDEQPEKSAKKKWSESKKMDHPDELIEEIEATKDVISPESELQKKQIELIDQFIKIQPSISSARERQQVPVADLNPVKSGEFGDNIVSETLVEILIKQGKKDKAVEVLKKLIWKYPQKKAYFASQIEDLKK